MRWTESWRQRGVLACPAAALLLLALSALGQTQPNLSGAPRATMPGLPPAPASRPAQPRFLVLIDPAHGGADDGAHLGAPSPGGTPLQEKDLVLALASSLRSALVAVGIEVVNTRTGDQAVPALNRAELANQNKPAACLSLHATTSGSGVHLFTSSVPPAAATQFLPWDAAQAPSMQQSLKLSSEINSAMTHAEIPVTLGRTSLQPLDSMVCPAVAVEVAPLTQRGSVATPLSDPAYQGRVIAALAAALDAWRRDWSVQP